MLIIMKKVFGITRALSDMLQSKDLDLAKACTLVDSTLLRLKQLRSDTEFTAIEKEATQFYHNNVDCLRSTMTDSMVSCRPKRARRVVQNSVITENMGHANQSTKMKYNEVLDNIISEIEHRFDNQNKLLLRSLQALIPSSDYFLSFEALLPFISHYATKIDADKLAVELPLAAHTIQQELETHQSTDVYGISDVLQVLVGYKQAFPQTKLGLR